MYFSLILENESGEQVNLSTTANQYMTSKIEGLNPPAGTISTSSYAGMNGSYLNNAFIEKRNVVISFAMRGIGIEKRRHQLYHVVKPSQYIKIWYKTANIDVYAEGYVETCEMSNFEQQISGQISILCPDIYWYSRDIFYAYYSGVIGAFHFPFPESDAPFPLGVYSNSNLFSITNDGDETGFTLRIEALPSDIPQGSDCRDTDHLQRKRRVSANQRRYSDRRCHYGYHENRKQDRHADTQRRGQQHPEPAGFRLYLADLEGRHEYLSG